MDVIFNCTNCEQELAVDAAAAGSEIQCPTCNTKLVIPEAEAGEPKPASAAPPSGPIPPPPEGGALPEHSGAMATSAAAKVHVHFSVPMHDKPGETLIKKAAKPLEVAAKDTEKKIRTKTIRPTNRK